MLKTCFKCRGSMEADGNFYRHPAMADGFLGKCKACTRRDVRENRNANIDYFRGYDRKRYEIDPQRKISILKYQTTERGKETLRDGKKRWARVNTRKRSAESAFGNWFRYHKDSKTACEVCGSLKVHAHHEDYNKPLEVRWLCPLHHSARHKELRVLGVRL